MKNTLLIILLLLSLIFLSCGRKDDNTSTIRIAEQFGLAYAPLQIMKEKRFFEEVNPRVKVQWLRLGNTAAIREAVLAGDLDAGFMGIPPFLIARDKGMPWKIATGLSRSPLGLVVPAEKYNSFTDFKTAGKIALPQPGSIQHILLAMACEREKGEAAFLDKNLLSLKHPDGMNALLSGAVEGHFTSPPYLFFESDNPEFEILLTGDEAMGEAFTFIIGAVTEDFFNNNRSLYNDFLQAVEKSMRFMGENRSETVSILSKVYSMEAAELENMLYRPGMVFESSVKGLDQFISFMHRSGYISKEYSERDMKF